MPQKKMYQERAKRKESKRLSELTYAMFMMNPKVKTQEQAEKMALQQMRAEKHREKKNGI